MDPATGAGAYDISSYFALVECGFLARDERVELLEGQIVSMAPPSPLHNAIVHHVWELLMRNLGPGVLVRNQTTFLAGPKSVPEPDVAVVPGHNSDYLRGDKEKIILHARRSVHRQAVRAGQPGVRCAATRRRGETA